MRVQFEFDIDDLADASARFIYHTPSSRRRILAWRAASSAAVGVVAGLIAYASMRVPAAPVVAAAAAAGAVLHWSAYRLVMRGSLRRRYLALLGSEGPFTCTVELTREGVVVRQFNARNLHEWANLISIEETADSIDFRSPQRYLVVRDRAFRSDEERDEFLATAHRYHATYARAGDLLPS